MSIAFALIPLFRKWDRRDGGNLVPDFTRARTVLKCEISLPPDRGRSGYEIKLEELGMRLVQHVFIESRGRARYLKSHTRTQLRSPSITLPGKQEKERNLNIIYVQVLLTITTIIVL